MKIVFDYDHATPRTVFTVNGRIRSDTFGELGAVSGYPLQSWLYPRGPWVGLRKILIDVARGRQMDIEFIGRRGDYLDFAAAIADLGNVSLTFQRAYEAEEADGSHDALRAAKRLLTEHPSPEVREETCALFDSYATPCLPLRVDTREAFQAQRSEIMCRRTAVLLSAGAFRSVREELLRMLRENFARPCGSIVVLASSPREKADLEEELKGSGVIPALADEPVVAAVVEKFGASEQAERLLVLKGQLHKLLAALFDRYEACREVNRKLRHAMLREEEEDEDGEGVYQDNLREIKWFQLHKEELNDLLAGSLRQVNG